MAAHELPSLPVPHSRLTLAPGLNRIGDMLTFWGVVTALAFCGGPLIVGGLWMLERSRSRHRNQTGKCAMCGSVWQSVPSDDPYLIHGRLVCEPCAEKARRRMPWHFGTLGVAAAVGTGLAAAGAGLPAMVLLPAGSTIVLTLGAVRLMKLANRNAQRRIATGEFPDLQGLPAMAEVHPEQEEPSSFTIRRC